METQKVQKLLLVAVAYGNPFPADDYAHTLDLLHLLYVDDVGTVHLHEAGWELLLYLAHRGSGNDRLPSLDIYLHIVALSLSLQDIGKMNTDIFVPVFDQQIVLVRYSQPYRLKGPGLFQ